MDGNIFDMKRLKANSKINKYTILEMLFADDAAVCAHSEEELQEMMTVFNRTFKEFGLELAIKKTEVMLQKAFPDEARPEPSIVLDGTVLKTVKQFKYLGAQLSDDAGTKSELNYRIKQSAAAFSKLYQRIWKKRHIKLKTKIKTYKAIVIPCYTPQKLGIVGRLTSESLMVFRTDNFEQLLEKLTRIKFLMYSSSHLSNLAPMKISPGQFQKMRLKTLIAHAFRQWSGFQGFVTLDML